MIKGLSCVITDTDIEDAVRTANRLMITYKHTSIKQRNIIPDGMSFSEIGKAMNCSSEAAKRIYLRAMRKLRRKYGVEQ